MNAPMTLRTIDTLPLHPGDRVLVRCDFNVPLHDGTVADDRRIRSALPTLQELRRRGAIVIACSHLGRPGGRIVPELSLAPVATRLGELLGVEVPLLELDDAAAPVAAARAGDVLLLENLRFHPEETSADADERTRLASRLAALADAVVSDGFGVVHRAQASTVEVEQLRPSAAGRLIMAELDASAKLLQSPATPYTVVLGGAKVSDKLGVIENLLPRIDRLLIGGGMAYTFLAALDNPVGASLCETERFDDCLAILRDASANGVQVALPVDVRVAAGLDARESQVVAADGIESTDLDAAAMGLDIGPRTEALFAQLIAGSGTVFWNGPMGVFERPAFVGGTRAVATALHGCPGYTVIGGGDSAAAVRALGFSDDDFSHISTGGGASLELLEGRPLPGLTVLGWSA